MKHKNIICIMAKDPRPGKVKNGLESCLSRKQTAMLARAFLLDAIATALRVPRTDVCIAFWPPEDKCDFENIIYLYQKEEKNEKISAKASDIMLIPQSGSDPGSTFSGLAEALFESGAGKVIFFCSDCPIVEPVLLEASFKILDNHKVVLGPTFDGGFYLVGFNEPMPSLFEGIIWGSEGLYRQITEKLNRCEISWQEMELSYDVDRPEELEQLYFDIDNLRLAGKDDLCIHTEKYLANLRK